MHKIYKDYFIKQMFFPGFLGLFVNPFYFARKGLFIEMQRRAVELGGNLLDVGCGCKPYRSLFCVLSYRGLDIDLPEVRNRGIADDFYDGKKFPYENEVYDSVLCNQVLEHVFNPDEFLGEIFRVLKPGGKLLLTVPFVWDEHEQPYDYARYSSFGLRALLEKNGFAVRQQSKINADATILFQMINAYLFKSITHFPRTAQLLFTITVMASINITGLLLSKLLPKNPDLFLDNVVLAERIHSHSKN